MLGWLAAVVAIEILYEQPKPLVRHAVDAAIRMSFISPAAFVSTFFVIDVVWDGGKAVAQKGIEIMGLLFDAVENKFSRQGRAEGRVEGLAEGRIEGLAEANAAFAAWYARMEQARREGREFNEPPPFLDNGRK